MKEYESVFAYVCVYLCILQFFCTHIDEYYTGVQRKIAKLFFYNFHSLCHLASIKFSFFSYIPN